jgi:Na+-transporting methylmalonyl-CoA/oxaloacetate decarboxylase beta subunit
MKNIAIQHPILGSSVDATKISLTVKGVLMAVITILVALGVNSEALELPQLVDAITNLIVQIGALASTGTVIVGIIRKIINAYK